MTDLYTQLLLARAAGDVEAMCEIARLIVSESLRAAACTPWDVTVA